MNITDTAAPDGRSFTVSIAGQPRTYPADKAGRRQAIVDTLSALTPLTVGDADYLSQDAALQTVAAVLYPAGIHTAEAFTLVNDVTEKACAHLGYGPVEELGPPDVPFAQRGPYRRQYPAVDPTLIHAELARATASRYEPRREANRRSLLNGVAGALHGRRLDALEPARQSQLERQVAAIVAEAGWQQPSADSPVYVQPLPLDAAAAEAGIIRAVQQGQGRPIPRRTVVAQAQHGAYGRAFANETLAPELGEVIAATLSARGYAAEPADGFYRPLPLVVPAGVETAVAAALAECEPVTTTLGPALLLRDVLTAVQPHLGVAGLSEWQVEELVERGLIGEALRRQGYQASLTWCRAYHFEPPLGDDKPHQVLLKEVRVTHDAGKKIALARGLPVHTPALTIDDESRTLVYLQMLGPKQAVKANWAALVGGGRTHWLGHRRIELSGMKEHIRLRSTLPCGWVDHILLHKQASLKEMNPEQPFYLLDDGTRLIPPLFYAMLNKSLALPLLPAWAEWLWANGRAERLITLLDDGQGVGYAAWRVLADGERWQVIVAGGLAEGKLVF